LHTKIYIYLYFIKQQRHRKYADPRTPTHELHACMHTPPPYLWAMLSSNIIILLYYFFILFIYVSYLIHIRISKVQNAHNIYIYLYFIKQQRHRKISRLSVHSKHSYMHAPTNSMHACMLLLHTSGQCCLLILLYYYIIF